MYKKFSVVNFVTHYRGDSIFGSNQYGHHSEGYVVFKNIALNLGLKVVENDPITSDSVVIFRDLPKIDVVKYRPKNCIFILHIWESPLQRQFLFDERNWELFDMVLSSNDSILNPKHRILRYFVDHYSSGDDVDFIDRKLAVAMCSNRYSGWLSSRRGGGLKGLPLLQEFDFEWNNKITQVLFHKSNELYSFRRKMLHKKNDLFDLYGRFWEKDDLSSWISKFHYFLPDKFKSKGEFFGDKRDIFKLYRYAMVFENYKNSSGYISEKIFECIQAGCVPVYIGCDNVTDYVSSDCVIMVNENCTAEKLKHRLMSIEEDEWLKYISAGRSYLSSRSFIDFFTADAFANTLLEYVLESINICKARGGGGA